MNQVERRHVDRWLRAEVVRGTIPAERSPSVFASTAKRISESLGIHAEPPVVAMMLGVIDAESWRRKRSRRQRPAG